MLVLFDQRFKPKDINFDINLILNNLKFKAVRFPFVPLLAKSIVDIAGDERISH